MHYNRLFLSFIALLIFSCQQDKIDTSTPDYLIPDATSLVIKIDDLESARTDVATTILFEKLVTLETFQKVDRQLEILELLNQPESVLMTFSKSTNESTGLDLSLIIPYTDSIFKFDSIPNVTHETIKKNKKEVYKTTLDSTIFYSQKIGHYLFIATDLKLVEDAEKVKAKELRFSELMAASKKESTVSFMYDSTILKEPWMVDDSTSMDFSGNTLLNLELRRNELQFNGVTQLRDSIYFLLDAFRGSKPKVPELPNIIPADVQYLKSLCFDSFDLFNTHMNTLIKTRETESPLFLQNSIEAGIILTKENNKAFIVKVIDSDLSIENLDMLTPLEPFRSVSLYEFEPETIDLSAFAPFINAGSPRMLAVMDDFLIFTENLTTIQEIITSYQNNNVLADNPRFLNVMEHMVRESSLFVYANESELNAIFANELDYSADQNYIDSNATASIQYVVENGFSHINGFIDRASSSNSVTGVSEEFSVVLDKELLMQPQFVKNHRNGQMDILVQDVNNTLYLISNEGKVFWKKRLDGAILGTVSQIDIFKNGRLQLVFATKNKIYLLDRTGRDVGKFPLTFNDDITQPLSVFDYDSNKKYRLLVTQGNSLLMYDKDGSPVKGFKYRSNGSTINSQPKHFRVKGKDYIVFSKGNEMEVLSRIGKTRIDVKDTFNFSENSIYLHENKFTTTSALGELIAVEMNGRAELKNLQLEDNHQLNATSKTLVTLSNNRLTIRGNQVELNYGNYTKPQIFYIDNKIYVSLTDLQSKKVYLFDSQAVPIANFPIYGNSAIDLDNIDKDSSLELVTKGNDDMIIIYEIN